MTGDEPRVDEPSAAPQRSRRQVLKVAGVSALGAGFAFAAGMPLLRMLTAETTPRVLPPAAGSMRIDHVTVIDPRDGSRREDTSILVRDGRITAVGPQAASATGTGVRVIDGAGRYAVPGYNNMHTHALQAADPTLMMITMLAEGVTGMRQMAGTARMLADRAEQRLPLGTFTPRLLAMPGEILTPFSAASVDDVRRAIDDQYEAGADFVKMVLTSPEVFFAAVEHAHRRGLRIVGHLPEGVSPSDAAAAGYDGIEHLGASRGMWIEISSRRDELRARDDTSLPFPAWMGGLPFVEDVMTARTATTLINPAAFNSPEVAALLTDAVDSFDEARAHSVAATFARHGTWHTPTLVRLRTQYLMDDPAYRDDAWLGRMDAGSRDEYADVLATFAALPAATRDGYRRVYAMAKRFTGILHEEGVPMMAATDGQGKVPGQSLQQEFRELGAAGIAPLDVLRMATSAPASFLGRPATMGVISPGADADLLLLGSDPTTDVANLGSVTAVVRGGQHLAVEELHARIEQVVSSGSAQGAERPVAAPSVYDCC